MLSRSNLFEYSITGCERHEGAAVARVRAGISSAPVLLQALMRALQFPSYFGFNWNALSDCLRDFHWVPQREVVLIHVDLPELPANELGTYLEVLADACESWQSDEQHALVVVFPDSAREVINRHLDRPW